MPEPSRLAPLLVASALAVALAACGGDEIRVYDVPKLPAAGAAHAPVPPEAGAPVEAHGLDLHWDAPASWTEQPAGGMRAASYRTPGGGDVSVVVLPGDAGGPLANVNRWRGQIGLAELDEAAFASQSRRLATRAGEAVYVDFAHGGTRVLAALLPSAGRTWFFKMTGPETAVAGAAGDFESLVSGVHAAH